ncbi:MAG: hypothetical protein CMP10_01525 [Zetaproteobacteria bacterium]|nr:hypothetical protein [Pseudobdellovibrionaceae bacterium]|tara:strand:- start:238 stop:879 length:642 start_codon:yes stop_codon:yes gene_type:complete
MVSLSKKISKSFLYLSAAVLLNSCGSDEDAATGSSGFTFKSSQFNTVTGTPTSTDTQVTGDASFVANTPLSAVASGSHFSFASTLEAGSYVTLTANGSAQNSGGVALKFENSDNVLKVTMTAGGTDKDISSSFSGLSATNVSYSMDVHNDETPAHVLIWAGDETDYAEAKAKFNSEEDGVADGNGTGSYWGVELKSATLTAVSVGEVKFEEED